MPDEVLPPPESNPLGAWVRERLRQDQIAWLTAVDARGIPQPNPVWFLWDGDASVLVYNTARAKRLRHIQQRPHVTLHLDSCGRGGEAIILTGEAAQDAEASAAHQHPGFMAKYGSVMRMPAQTWAEMFPIPVRIRLVHFRGFHLTG